MNENTKKMWADPRFQFLADLDRLFDSSKIWGGMEWVYHPIQPAKYRPMSERVRAELGKLYQEYGVEMNFARFCELTQHKLTEVSHFIWPCFGENAHHFSYWNEDHDGFSINTIVRLDGMIVEVLEVCDYAGNRAYRWFNPNTGARDAYMKSAVANSGDQKNQAWDDVDFVDLEVLEDFIAKAEAIRDGRDYDDGVKYPHG